MKSDVVLSTAQLRQQFNRTGLRLTAQRERVWRLFENTPVGCTIPRAIALLGRERIGQATVYRTIRALQSIGLLKWVHDVSGEHRFVATRPGHSHLLVCRVCSRMVECRDCDLSILEKLIARQTGFAVEGHHLEFFGLCPDCV